MNSLDYNPTLNRSTFQIVHKPSQYNKFPHLKTFKRAQQHCRKPIRTIAETSRPLCREQTAMSLQRYCFVKSVSSAVEIVVFIVGERGRGSSILGR